MTGRDKIPNASNFLTPSVSLHFIPARAQQSKHFAGEREDAPGLEEEDYCHGREPMQVTSSQLWTGAQGGKRGSATPGNADLQYCCCISSCSITTRASHQLLVSLLQSQDHLRGGSASHQALCRNTVPATRMLYFSESSFIDGPQQSYPTQEQGL